jgi:hypothetical protein
MAEELIIATEDQKMVARSGLTIQAEAHGLDLSDSGVQAFIDGQVEVQAQMAAEITFVYKIMHKQMGMVSDD